MAVFLVVGCLLFGSWFLRKTGNIEEKGVFGGPADLISSARGAELDPPAALGDNGRGVVIGSDGSVGNGLAIGINDVSSLEDATIRDPGQSIGPAFDRSGTVSYSVREGDNLSRIAIYFGISIDTIASVNPGVKSKLLKVGQALKILPTSGVIYQTRSGDTLESIADNFGIAQDKIVQFNRSANFASLDPGTSIVIPGGKNINLLAAGGAALPNFNDQFIIPANGYNWGILHHYNAVDIANSCGTPVIAAAEGLVVPDDNTPAAIDEWNGGYGNFVLIEHPFGDGVRTRYAHLEKLTVQIGDYVKQGQVIGLMGDTGEASGCHVHFEVYEAQNPFAKS